MNYTLNDNVFMILVVKWFEVYIKFVEFYVNKPRFPKT